MKKLLLVLLLFSASVQAQILDLDQFAKKSELASLKKTVDSLKTVPAVIVSPSDPVTTLPGCKTGPALGKITNVSRTYLNFQFDAEKVYRIAWVINDENGNQLRSGTTAELVNNNPGITYNTLPAGKYYLVIQGATCSSKISSKTFTIPDGTGIITPTNPVIRTGFAAFSQTPKKDFHLKNQGGVYSDDTEGDYIENGITYRNENGKKYRALYWVNETAWKNADGSVKSFQNVKLANGLIPSIRKEYAKVGWRGAENHEAFLNSGWDIWLHGGENKDACADCLLYTIVNNFTTNGGADLNEAGMVRDNNPGWLDAGNVIPQFFYNASPYKSDKPVCIQAFPVTGDVQESIDKLAAGGVTHLWWQNLHGAGFFKDGQPAPGINTHGILPAFNLSSTDYFNIIKNRFGRELKPYDATPAGQATCEEARAVARNMFICEGCVYTDEFTEGTYPQFPASRECFYDEFNKIVLERGYKNVQLLGDYGYGSQNINLKGYDQNIDPVSDLAFSLLTDKVGVNLPDNSGNLSSFKDYFQNASKYRGTVIGAYYAITRLTPDRGPNKFLEAMISINAVPDKPKMLFTSDLMQSNSHGADVPYKDSGTIMPNGVISQDYPDTPAEIMKFDTFFSLLQYDSWYYWQAFGAKNVKDGDWRRSGIALDAAMVGTRMYARLIPKLNEVNREIYACDYTSNGVEFTSPSVERRLPQRGTPRFNNRYFNDVLAQKRGLALCIPSNEKAFIYYNTYLTPDQIERVVITYKGKKYDIGEVAGSTFVVVHEK